MSTRAAATCFLLVSLAAVPLARADGAPEPIRVRYAAPDTCEGSGTFESAVLRRTGKARLAGEDENAREFDVEIEWREDRWLGRLSIRDQAGASSERRVDGVSCQEVVHALALIAALAIDPQALASPDPPPAVPAPASPPVPAPTAPPSATATTPAPPAPRPAPPRAGTTDSPRWGAGIGLQLSSTWGPAPDAIWTLPLFAEASWGVDRAGQPRVRLSFSRGRSDAFDTTTGSGQFLWTVARVDGCVTAWQLPHRLRFVPCVAFEGGALEGQGSGVDHPRSQTRLWLAPGVEARVQVIVLGPLFLEGQGALMIPLVRDRFYLEPNTTLHQAPALAPSVAVGLGSYFL